MVELSLLRSSLLRQKALYGLWILALGSALCGLLIIDVYRQSLSVTLQNQGRKILTGDVSLSTRKSFSDDESKIGRPTGFTITVREFEYAVGAGFIIPILGEMMRMPGLPAVPASEHMDIDNNGVITGLS